MPKIAQFKQFIFFFYAFDLTERRHVHVESKKGRFRNPAKIWIENGVEVFDAGNLTQAELNEVCRVITENLDLLNEQFALFIAGKKVKKITLS